MGTATTAATGTGVAPAPGVAPGSGERPTARLAMYQLLQISVFWFTTNAIWGGQDIFQQERSIQLLGKEGAPFAVGVLDLLMAPIGMLVMPVMGSVSDYAGTRWGRRKPFILTGALAAAVALVGLAFAPTFPLVVIFFLLLSAASNVARGPFAGLVPDVVPEEQVGLASGLMGLMTVLGVSGGFLVIWFGYLLGTNFTLPLVVLAAIVAATGVGTFLWTPNGPPPKPREGRAWTTIALETFAPDILRSRDYVFLLGSRFFVMMGGGFFMNLNVLFLAYAFGMDADERGPLVFAGLVAGAIASTVATMPAARLGDRIGRKPVIYASALLGAAAIALISLAPVPEVAIAGVAMLGLAFGAFLSVDWALMTSIIPMASAGRYMGFSNIVDALNGPIASALGAFTMTLVARGFGDVVGGRAGMLLGVLVFCAGIVLLRPVHEPRHAAGGAAGAGTTPAEATVQA
jgi:MFS family permease